MSKGRIYLIHSDEKICAMINIYFTSKGYKVFTSPTAETMPESIISTMPDAIILECSSTDQKGRDFFLNIRKHKDTVLKVKHEIKPPLQKAENSGQRSAFW